MYAKRAAATVSRTRDQGNQNPRVPKLNLEDTNKEKITFLLKLTLQTLI